MNEPRLKFLVIRRDNIGDLVCTTPLFSALRAHFPEAEICALVNSYNVAVLENNTDIDAVYAYTKAKHRPPGKSTASVYWDRMVLFLTLRRKHFDYAILAATSTASVPRALALARIVRPRHIIGYAESKNQKVEAIDFPITFCQDEGAHETENVFKLLGPLGITGSPPPLRVSPDFSMVEQARKKIDASRRRILVGIHISARKPSQRWPTDRFIELIQKLAHSGTMSFVLFWSPGNETNPLHPGDDRKANEILLALAGQPVVAYPTHRLQELIAGLSLCDALICSDGGAMHLAAGLAKPILCFFGKSGAAQWHPWGVPHVLLQPESKEVSDISVAEALEGFNQVLAKSGQLAV